MALSTRTLTCPVPDNIHPLNSAGFLFSIAKIPEMTYFCQEVALPSVTNVDIEQYNPFVKVPLPGDTLTYGQLNVQFMVDNKFANYKAIFDWLYAIGYPESNNDYTQYVGTHGTVTPNAYPNLFSDATLTILDNTNQPIQIVQFTDAFPISLESLTFSSVNGDTQYLVGNATFSYTLYKFL